MQPILTTKDFVKAPMLKIRSAQNDYLPSL